ncbi:MAG: GNAT family N-acetyltransferase [Candidatus Saccharibacteria bacterium]|nr:GNAT family N-acetyltransferase [Moraxellaceae bacterium]
MDIITDNISDLSQNLYNRVAQYRYKIFIERLGWELKTKNNEELDQFDRLDTIYIVAQDNNQQIQGCARLLPTNKQYLLGEVFPQLIPAGLPLPNSSEVWELSRFAAVDLANENSAAVGQFSSSVAVSLLQAAIDCAAAQGAKRIITVSPIGVERLLRKAGFNAHRAGPPMIIDGYPLFACWIEITTEHKIG